MKTWQEELKQLTPRDRAFLFAGLVVLALMIVFAATGTPSTPNPAQEAARPTAPVLDAEEQRCGRRPPVGDSCRSCEHAVKHSVETFDCWRPICATRNNEWYVRCSVRMKKTGVYIGDHRFWFGKSTEYRRPYKVELVD